MWTIVILVGKIIFIRLVIRIMVHIIMIIMIHSHIQFVIIIPVIGIWQLIKRIFLMLENFLKGSAVARQSPVSFRRINILQFKILAQSLNLSKTWQSHYWEKYINKIHKFLSRLRLLLIGRIFFSIHSPSPVIKILCFFTSCPPFNCSFFKGNRSFFILK